MRLRYIPSGDWLDRNELFMLRLIGLLVVLAIVLVATGYADRLIGFINPDRESCMHGRCEDSCTFENEIQKFSVKCIDSSKVCCVPKNKVVSPECSGLHPGDACGERSMCDDSLKCVSKCEYCSRFPLDELCLVDSGTAGRSVTLLNSRFKCGCTANECSDLAMNKLGTCVEDFCPLADSGASDYMCCDN